MNPYQKYMQQSVTTMTPAQLLIALYDKAITEINKAIIFIEDKDIPKAHNSIMRVSDIIDALDAHLKVKYEISDNLAALYQYFRERLVQANVKKDPEILKEILPMITELRNAFYEAGKTVR
ncbi:MAG: flagellar export chaperone FliS [Oscillospiraceae bacterium]|nr:flagellar export chaperone FliS [Oscillospiraceae bacterium]MCI7498536.1 flagellar export chaperone FliS [Oscillospiraceae bacterium]MDD7278040.1 flagellar export chaperone FliS [Oscillospiraceae bacterium]MDY2863511.1 flagellar export chaperone FliS [Oscillospiraceae bacterium]